MEVFVGPTFTIEPSPPPTTQTNRRLFLEPEESSSSIGIPDDSDNEEEVQSEGINGLDSLNALEDSLPIKRGLSSHFDGKSKSFTDLSRVNSLKELQKQESPFNKRRRVLIVSKFSTKSSSFYSWSNPQSMPLLPLTEDRYEEDDDYEDFDQEKTRKVSSGSSSSSSSSSSLSEDKKQIPESYAAEMRVRLRSFKSRSFSLADLQEHEDEDEDEEDDEDN